MNHNIKKALAYLILPCLFTGLICGLYVLYGATADEYINTQVYAAIEKGNPQYHYTFQEAKVDDLTKETVSKGEIKKPSIGEQYGTISCEAIDLMAPLYFGDNDDVLAMGAGQYAKSKLPGFGGCILIGGHDSTYFSVLADIKKDQEIVLQTEYGTYTYKVRETKVAKTDDIDACQLDSKEEQLVLYTCYPFGELLRARDERYFVYCNKIAGPTVEEDYQ